MILFLMLSLIQIFYARILTQIPPPHQQILKSSYLESYTVGDTIEIQFNHIHSFASSLHQRRSPIKKSYIIDDFDKDTDQYTTSDVCKIVPPEISFNKMANMSLDFIIKDIQVDFSNTTIYILSSQFQIFRAKFKRLDFDTIVFDGKSERLAKINSTSEFVSMEFYQQTSLLCILNQNKLFFLNVSSNQIIQTPEFNITNITKVRWYIKKLCVITSEGEVYIFKVNNDRKVDLQQKISTFNNSTISLIDVWCDNSQLWVLSNDTIYIYKFLGRYLQHRSISVDYGNNRFFQKLGNTLQLVFDLKDHTYMAELHYEDDTLVLNRFYDQLNHISQLYFVNDLMIVLGHDEIMATRHSINRHLLQKKLDLSTFFPSLKQRKIQFPQIMNYQQMLIVVSTDHQISVSKFRRTNNKLQCQMKNYQSRYSMFIEMKTTVCTESMYQSQVDLLSYCTLRFGVQLQQVSLHKRKVSNLISMALLCIIVLIGVVVVGLTIQLKRSRETEIVGLSKILDRRKRSKGDGLNQMNVNKIESFPHPSSCMLLRSENFC